jgi:hypothetical protein
MLILKPWMQNEDMYISHLPNCENNPEAVEDHDNCIAAIIEQSVR